MKRLRERIEFEALKRNESEFSQKILTPLLRAACVPDFYKVVPKIKASKGEIKLVQFIISTSKYDNRDLLLYFGLLAILIQEGSAVSTKLVDNFCAHKTFRKDQDFPRIMSSLINRLGRAKNLKKLGARFDVVAKTSFDQTDLSSMLVQNGLNELKKEGFRLQIFVAEGLPPAYLGAGCDKPWIYVLLQPSILDHQWEIRVTGQKDSKRSRFSGIPQPEIIENELKLPVVKSFSNIPHWIRSVERKLAVVFDFSKTKFLGSKLSKTKKQILVDWLSGGR
jgi:hypothetical protein